MCNNVGAAEAGQLKAPANHPGQQSRPELSAIQLARSGASMAKMSPAAWVSRGMEPPPEDGSRLVCALHVQPVLGRGQPLLQRLALLLGRNGLQLLLAGDALARGQNVGLQIVLGCMRLRSQRVRLRQLGQYGT